MTLLPRGLVPLALAFLLAAVTGGAHAQGLMPSSVFVQAGSGENGVDVASVGVGWPWAWRTTFWGGQVSAETEVFASHWRAGRVGGGNQSYTQLGVVPMFRW